MNVCSSVGLIMANKAVMAFFNFRYATTLTGLHFAITAGVGILSKYAGYLSDKTVPFWTLFWFSLIADLSVVGMNVSLMLNSVGFYQISKLSIIPTCCVFEAFLNGKTFSNEVKVSVAVVMVGVGICTVTDVSVNFVGFLTAFIAVVSTTLQQIYVGSLQKKYNIGSFDLLSQTAPLQAVCMIAVGPMMDFILAGENVFTYPLSLGSAACILLSCILALFVNVSAYLCIGKFSAVSFQVLGHMKTILVLVLGWVLFDSKLTGKNLLGMSVAIAGMFMYSWAVEVDRARLHRSMSSSSVKMTDSGGNHGSESREESKPLVGLESGRGEAESRN